MEKVQRWNRITLISANSLWCQTNYTFTDAFLNLVRTHYRADARQVDFRHAPRAASDEINRWVEKKTSGRIKTMIDPARFDSYSSLVLCDAIYFKGRWATQFKPSETKPAPFYVTASNTVTLPMMYQKARLRSAYADDLSVEMLELPYAGHDLSMIILLPSSENGSSRPEYASLADAEEKLTAGNLRAWLASLDSASPHETHVFLPRFTARCSFEIGKELNSLGMTSAFSDKANFSGMDGTTNLFISDAIHAAFVEVNEAGTEAAATTSFQVKTKSMTGRFNANHPFIFLIRENGSGSILFLGRVIDPTKQ
jgi:serine protease inhibitor